MFTVARGQYTRSAAIGAPPESKGAPQVAAALWVLLLREAALPRHLEAVKDYFLLGAGDFFQTFLQEARASLRAPV
jgi:hypothetical protein